ncbi:hypothetical protein [Deinococcus hopiensis]|uniref:hypothetical protein n=1 Tax=Deinococcus hopiensis TaxID=309885 RepID=UPI001BB09EA5|nr:hypothetical protein [Deinococcus hopiensis]
MLVRVTAEITGRHLGLTAVSVPQWEATEYFGCQSRFLAADPSASCTRTRELLCWQPSHP